MLFYKHSLKVSHLTVTGFVVTIEICLCVMLTSSIGQHELYGIMDQKVLIITACTVSSEIEIQDTFKLLIKYIDLICLIFKDCTLFHTN